MGFFKILSRMSCDVLRLWAGKGSIKLWGGVGEGRRGVCVCVGGGGWGMGWEEGWGDFRSNAPLSPPECSTLKKKKKKKKKKGEEKKKREKKERL